MTANILKGKRCKELLLKLPVTSLGLLSGHSHLSQLRFQRLHVGSLKWAIAVIFTPQ